jgi:hypothetical protein
MCVRPESVAGHARRPLLRRQSSPLHHVGIGTVLASASPLSENLHAGWSVLSGWSVWLSVGGGLTRFSPVDRVV